MLKKTSYDLELNKTEHGYEPSPSTKQAWWDSLYARYLECYVAAVSHNSHTILTPVIQGGRQTVSTAYMVASALGVHDGIKVFQSDDSDQFTVRRSGPRSLDNIRDHIAACMSETERADAMLVFVEILRTDFDNTVMDVEGRKGASITKRNALLNSLRKWLNDHPRPEPQPGMLIENIAVIPDAVAVADARKNVEAAKDTLIEELGNDITPLYQPEWEVGQELVNRTLPSQKVVFSHFLDAEPEVNFVDEEGNTLYIEDFVIPDESATPLEEAAADSEEAPETEPVVEETTEEVEVEEAEETTEETEEDPDTSEEEVEETDDSEEMSDEEEMYETEVVAEEEHGLGTIPEHLDGADQKLFDVEGILQSEDLEKQREDVTAFVVGKITEQYPNVMVEEVTNKVRELATMSLHSYVTASGELPTEAVVETVRDVVLKATVKALSEQKQAPVVQNMA